MEESDLDRKEIFRIFGSWGGIGGLGMREREIDRLAILFSEKSL